MSEIVQRNLKPPKTGIIVDYYEGPYGPTILIDTMTWSELQKIKRIFVDLAHGEVDFVNLTAMDGVTAIGIDSLILRKLGDKDQRDVSLERKKNTSRTMEFSWSLRSEDWWGCVNLVEGFIEDRPNHNYLTTEDVDDALIILQYQQSAAYRGLDN